MSPSGALLLHVFGRFRVSPWGRWKRRRSGDGGRVDALIGLSRDNPPDGTLALSISAGQLSDSVPGSVLLTQLNHLNGGQLLLLHFCITIQGRNPVGTQRSPTTILGT